MYCRCTLLFLLENSEKCVSDMIMFSCHQAVKVQRNIQNTQTPRCGLLKFPVTFGEELCLNSNTRELLPEKLIPEIHK